jgi:hypothetical protein
MAYRHRQELTARSRASMGLAKGAVVTTLRRKLALLGILGLAAGGIVVAAVAAGGASAPEVSLHGRTVAAAQTRVAAVPPATGIVPESTVPDTTPPPATQREALQRYNSERDPSVLVRLNADKSVSIAHVRWVPGHEPGGPLFDPKILPAGWDADTTVFGFKS